MAINNPRTKNGGFIQWENYRSTYIVDLFFQQTMFDCQMVYRIGQATIPLEGMHIHLPAIFIIHYGAKVLITSQVMVQHILNMQGGGARFHAKRITLWST